ncbi:nuclear transport factor 2 family protein [Pendulispora rubella]|uniref:Nuclear transport factor 2 family protein n=1 Tax=Pendulispora rubella TaxID=2741070 RepID=A0ABZ2LGB0_9BACT
MFLVVFLAGKTTEAATSDADALQLIALDKAMQKSVVDRDAKAFANFLTDDYTLVSGSGRIYDKAAVVAEMSSPDVRYDVNESSDWRVRVTDNTALVIAILHSKGIDHGKPFDQRIRFTDTWIRRGEKGAWRNIAGHASKLGDGVK